MKIDFIINSLGGGGAERVMATLANGFSAKYDVTLVTFNPGSAYSINSTVNRLKLHQGKIRNHTIRSWFNLFRHYRRSSNKPDVIVVFMPANALVVLPIAKYYGINVIVSEHNNHKANPSRKSNWIRKFLYPMASSITILTSYDFDFYKNLNKRVVVMPNPIIIPSFINQFAQRKKNILAAGSLKRLEVKGFESLLEIAAPILKQNKDWTLTIAGSGGDGEEILRKLSERLDITNQVILPGFCKNIHELMQNSQIFALPSKFEGLPMVLMEALSNGMACIAYDCVSGPSELIDDQVNGLLIENQNAEKFQSGLKKLVIDDKFRAELAKNGPDSIRPFELSEILNRWETLFKEIKCN
jgi:GalNAc-alpha-(1->4)-GalNAc-alpha-(1->3)-diNAcBac-PP-undecaprenol alpha-1,4-N-acetyl-D-galactosaminyltransferase